MTINISDCNQEANMYLLIHDCSDLLTAIFLIDTSLHCPILTPAFSCGVACPRSSPIAGAGGFILNACHWPNARLNCRSGGSVDPFWPSVARKTQAVVDAVMQACQCGYLYTYIYLFCCYFDLKPWAAPFEF